MGEADPYHIPGTEPVVPTQHPEHPNVERRANMALSVARGALVVAAVAALFTGWYACEAHRQASIMERARLDAKQALADQTVDVERARKAAEDSAKAAMVLAEVGKQSLSITDRGAIASEHSARTAEESLKTTKELFAEGRRAEMSRISTVMQAFETGKPPKYEIHFLNSGRSRAVGVTTVTSFLVLPADQVFPSEPIYNLRGPPSVSVVLPGEQLVQTAEAGVVATAALKDSVNSGIVRVYVHGKITYDDVDGRHHTTNFCDYYVPTNITLTACSLYNTAN